MGECAGLDEGAGCVIDAEVEAGEVVVGDDVELAGTSAGGGVDGGVLGGVDGDADLDALVDAEQVGRGVEAGAVAGVGEDGGKRGGGGAFAVGSGDKDGREASLRIAERRGESAHVGEIELAACGSTLRRVTRGWR